MVRVLVVALVALAAPQLPAGAHAAADYYNSKWQRDRSVEWRFTAGVPDTAFRDRVRDGAGRWNSLGPSMHFDKLSGDYANFDPYVCPGSYQKDGVHRRYLSGDTLAVTLTCRFSGTSELYSFQIVFDEGRSWYNGTGTPGSNEFDTEGVATHEFGHATGWSGHFGDSWDVCQPPDKHTMCPTIAPGTIGARALEEHDKHTFVNAY